jgi:hypothetical protein
MQEASDRLVTSLPYSSILKEEALHSSEKLVNHHITEDTTLQQTQHFQLKLLRVNVLNVPRENALRNNEVSTQTTD